MTRLAYLLPILAAVMLAACEPVPPVPPGPQPPSPVPDGPAMLLCLRPWTCTLDQSDADLLIRESIDAAGKNDLRYLSVLPGTLDQRMQPHAGIEAYRELAPSLPWVFHVVPVEGGNPLIANQGPLDASAVLGWIGVSQITHETAAAAEIDTALVDVDFFAENPELCGAIPATGLMRDVFSATFTNVSDLPGFRGISKSEAAAWCDRFPLSRMYPSVAQHIFDQGRYGSCVGMAGTNCVEGAEFHQFGVRYFRDLSGLSLYKRISRSSGSGAMVGDGASETNARGILPADGEVNAAGVPYAHTFDPEMGYSTKLPSGWESTAQAWRAQIYVVDDEDSARRVLLDWRCRTAFGRSRHSISGFLYQKNGKWLYENSWSSGWGDPPGVGYDSRFYYSYTYIPVLRDEIPVLVSQ